MNLKTVGRFFLSLVFQFLFGLIKCFTGLFGIIFGIIVMLLALFGVWGSFFNHKKALFMMLIGMAVLMLIEIGYFVFNFFIFKADDSNGGEKSEALFAIILSAIMFAFYFACAFVGFRLWKA